MVRRDQGELNRLVHLIRDRAQGDETAIWRIEKVLNAHRRASVGDERTLLTALSVVFNAASLLCRDR